VPFPFLPTFPFPSHTGPVPSLPARRLSRLEDLFQLYHSLSFAPPPVALVLSFFFPNNRKEDPFLVRLVLFFLGPIALSTIRRPICPPCASSFRQSRKGFPDHEKLLSFVVTLLLSDSFPSNGWCWQNSILFSRGSRLISLFSSFSRVSLPPTYRESASFVPFCASTPA